MGWMIPIIAASNRNRRRNAPLPQNDGCLEMIGCLYLGLLCVAIVFILFKGMGVV